MSVFTEELAASITQNLAKSLEGLHAKIFQEIQDAGLFLAVIVTLSEQPDEERLVEIKERIAATIEREAPSRVGAPSWGVALYVGTTAIDGFFGGQRQR